MHEQGCSASTRTMNWIACLRRPTHYLVVHRLKVLYVMLLRFSILFKTVNYSVWPVCLWTHPMLTTTYDPIEVSGRWHYDSCCNSPKGLSLYNRSCYTSRYFQCDSAGTQMTMSVDVCLSLSLLVCRQSYVRRVRKLHNQSTWKFRTVLGPWQSITGCSIMT